MGDFRPLRGRGKGGRVPILSHPYKGILSHFSDNVTGGRDAIITVWRINIHYWQFYDLLFVRIQAIICNFINRGHGFSNQLSIGYNNRCYKGARTAVIRMQE